MKRKRDREGERKEKRGVGREEEREGGRERRTDIHHISRYTDRPDQTRQSQTKTLKKRL